MRKRERMKTVLTVVAIVIITVAGVVAAVVNRRVKDERPTLAAVL